MVMPIQHTFINGAGGTGVDGALGAHEYPFQKVLIPQPPGGGVGEVGVGAVQVPTGAAVPSEHSWRRGSDGAVVDVGFPTGSDVP